MKTITPCWLNGAEVEEMHRLFQGDPILGPGARFLRDLMEFVNNTTDGWAFHGTANAAGELQGILKEASYQKRGYSIAQRDYEAPTAKDIEKACRKAITNFKRKKHYRNMNVTAYGATWPTLETAVQLELNHAHS